MDYKNVLSHISGKWKFNNDTMLLHLVDVQWTASWCVNYVYCTNNAIL